MKDHLYCCFTIHHIYFIRLIIISQTELQCSVILFCKFSFVCLVGSHLFPIWYKNLFPGSCLSDVIHHSEHDTCVCYCHPSNTIISRKCICESRLIAIVSLCICLKIQTLFNQWMSYKWEVEITMSILYML